MKRILFLMNILCFVFASNYNFAHIPLKLVNATGFTIYVNVKARTSMQDQAPETIFSGSIESEKKRTIKFPENKIFTVRAWNNEADWKLQSRERSMYGQQYPPEIIKTKPAFGFKEQQVYLLIESSLEEIIQDFKTTIAQLLANYKILKPGEALKVIKEYFEKYPQYRQDFKKIDFGSGTNLLMEIADGREFAMRDSEAEAYDNAFLDVVKYLVDEQQFEINRDSVIGWTALDFQPTPKIRDYLISKGAKRAYAIAFDHARAVKAESAGEPGIQPSAVNEIKNEMMEKEAETKAGIDTVSGLVAKFASLNEYNQTALSTDAVKAALDNLEQQQPTVPAKVLNYLIDEFCAKVRKDIDGDLKQDESYVQKKTVPSGSKIGIVGDIHGSGHSLLRILLDLKKNDYLDDDFKINEKKPICLVFTGDYADRGVYGAEVWYALLKLKMKNWDRVFLLRGNHETKKIAERYGFFGSSELDLDSRSELSSKYKDKDDQKTLVASFIKAFNYLPLALYIGSGKEGNINWIQYCHAGFPLDEIITIGEKAYKTYVKPSDPNSVKNWQKTFLNTKNINFQKISCDIYPGFSEVDFKLQGEDIYTTKARATGGFEYEKFRLPVEHDKLDENRVSNMFDSYGVKAIFRAHQHLFYGLKMFKKNQTQRDLKMKDMKLVSPIYWKRVVVAQNERVEIPIFKYIPVFTFTTATEFQLSSENFYAILTTADDYKNWKLKPCTLKIKEHESENVNVKSDEIKMSEEEAALVSFKKDFGKAIDDLSVDEALAILKNYEAQGYDIQKVKLLEHGNVLRWVVAESENDIFLPIINYLVEVIKVNVNSENAFEKTVLDFCGDDNPKIKEYLISKGVKAKQVAHKEDEDMNVKKD